MAAVFAVLSVIAGIWSAVKYQITYMALADSLPPQFREELASRYAFPVHALAAPSGLHEIPMGLLRLLPLRRAGLFLSFKCPVRLHHSRGFFLVCRLNEQILEDLQGKLQSGSNQGCRNGLDAA